jgi:hypothetical protein
MAESQIDLKALPASGNYKLKKGDKSCLEGDLKWVELDNTTALSLGPRSLADVIDKEDHFYQEADCSYYYKNKLDKNGLLHHEVREECLGLPKIVRRLDIEKNKKGFSYDLSVTSSDNKKPLKIHCALEKAN